MAHRLRHRPPQCQMACYSAGPVSQGALLALTKVLAGHVGHSGRALATQRLFWLVAQGRLSLAALRTLELHKSIREMVSDKLFVAHKSTGEPIVVFLPVSDKLSLRRAIGGPQVDTARHLLAVVTVARSVPGCHRCRRVGRPESAGRQGNGTRQAVVQRGGSCARRHRWGENEKMRLPWPRTLSWGKRSSCL